jgi:hypothetical protein
VICILSVRLCIPPPHLFWNGWTNLYNTWFVFYATWAHLNVVLHKSIPSVCMPTRVSPFVARQRFGNNVTAVTNIHGTIEELFDASFSVPSLLHQGKKVISNYPNFLLLRWGVIWNASEHHGNIVRTHRMHCFISTPTSFFVEITRGLFFYSQFWLPFWVRQILIGETSARQKAVHIN